MQNHKPITLITFDVDGTLLKGSPSSPHASLHAKAFLYAAGKLAGVEDFDQQHDSPLDFLPSHKYHGSTDGLILLNLMKNAFGHAPDSTFSKLPLLFGWMQDYVSARSDEILTNTIIPIPGVIESLERISKDKQLSDKYLCGLVTGNVEGIARKKMRACGILRTGILSPKSTAQNWQGEDDASFLGGFGTDYCSGDIENPSKNFIDRGQQICIAYERAKTMVRDFEKITRVVHVGDAPADVLAARWCSEQNKFGDNVVVSCVGVATGCYSADELKLHAGDSIAGRWEPIVLEDGVADENFVKACGLI